MFALIGAAEEFSVEQLDPDHSKDKLEQCYIDDNGF